MPRVLRCFSSMRMAMTRPPSNAPACGPRPSRAEPAPPVFFAYSGPSEPRKCPPRSMRVNPSGTLSESSMSGSRPEAIDAPLPQGERCLPPEQLHPLAEGAEAGIARRALHVALVDLLDDDGDLEEREDVIEERREALAAALARVRLDQALAGEAAGQERRPVRARAHLLWVLRVRPVAEQGSEVEEWIAYRGHLPVEDRDDAGEIGRVEHYVVVLV